MFLCVQRTNYSRFFNYDRFKLDYLVAWCNGSASVESSNGELSAVFYLTDSFACLIVAIDLRGETRSCDLWPALIEACSRAGVRACWTRDWERERRGRATLIRLHWRSVPSAPDSAHTHAIHTGFVSFFCDVSPAALAADGARARPPFFSLSLSLSLHLWFLPDCVIDGG